VRWAKLSYNIVSVMEEEVSYGILRAIWHVCDERERVTAAENNVHWLRRIKTAFKLVQLELEGCMVLADGRASFDIAVAC